MNAFNSPKCSTVHVAYHKIKTTFILMNSYCPACALERSLRGTCRWMLHKRSLVFPFSASVQLIRKLHRRSHPTSRFKACTHVLPPEALLSTEVSPSHHPTACPLAPVPIAPLAAHSSWTGSHGPPHPLPAALPPPSTPGPA